jgi:acetate kinase
MAAVQGAGFRVLEASTDYVNPWIVDNRYRNRVELYDESLQPLEYPVTNMVLVAVKA